LLKDESELADVGIYVFSYRTDINTGSYSLSDIVDSLREYFLLDGLIDSLGIVFVCHSMGGIVARRFLVKEQSLLLSRGLDTISLFLVASPSLGSEYANMLSLVSRVIGHTQASALQFSQNNVWLNDLDKDFMNFKANESLRIQGKELIEDLPLYGKGLIRKQIVEPFSGARYFGNSFKVPGSDHITIATPASRDAVQHRLLVKFVKEFLEKFRSQKPIGSNQITDSPSGGRNIGEENIEKILSHCCDSILGFAYDFDNGKGRKYFNFVDIRFTHESFLVYQRDRPFDIFRSYFPIKDGNVDMELCQAALDILVNRGHLSFGDRGIMRGCYEITPAGREYFSLILLKQNTSS
jgi:hypothetical protein